MFSAAGAIVSAGQRSTHGAQYVADAWGGSHGRQLAHLTQHCKLRKAHDRCCTCEEQQMGCKLHIMQASAASNTANA